MSYNHESSLDMLDLHQTSWQERHADSVSNFQVPEPEHGPSSWKLLETRAISFPHTRSAAQISFDKENYQKGEMGGTRRWISSSQNKQTLYRMNPLTTLSPTLSPSPTRVSKRLATRRAPVLTLALLKLDENLSEFCKILEDPTYDNVQKACRILDSSVATATNGSNPPVSPKNLGNGPRSPQRTSPSLSPIAKWFSGGSASTDTSPTSSAVALEGEWETFCNPLIVFAGLEGLYASLTHAESSELAWGLSKLYERITSDLIAVRETLCDPFLFPQNDVTLSTDGSGSNPDKLFACRESAAVVALTLDSIVNVCQCRCTLVWHQRELWSHKETINLSDASAAFQSILPSAKTFDVTHHATPIVANLHQEVRSWYHLMEMALSLEQLR